MGTLVVGISDCSVSVDPADTVATYALGSCVGVSLYEPWIRIGGILHVMLPDSRYRSPLREFNPYMYADTGLREFLQTLEKLGGDRRRIEARVAGGANMFQSSKLLDVGRRNAETMLSLLRSERIPVLGTSLGGVVGRSMSLRIRNGQVLVRMLGHGEDTKL
jgi:chemotaxis protein CheD